MHLKCGCMKSKNSMTGNGKIHSMSCQVGSKNLELPFLMACLWWSKTLEFLWRGQPLNLPYRRSTGAAVYLWSVFNFHFSSVRNFLSVFLKLLLCFCSVFWAFQCLLPSFSIFAVIIIIFAVFAVFKLSVLFERLFPTTPYNIFIAGAALMHSKEWMEKWKHKRSPALCLIQQTISAKRSLKF